MTYKIRDRQNAITLFEWDDDTKLLTDVIYMDTGKANWVENKIVNRVGNIRHFMGSDDAKLKLIMQFDAGARHTNFDTINDLKNAGTVIHLDIDDWHSKWGGLYSILSVSMPKNLGPFSFEFEIVLAKFNN